MMTGKDHFMIAWSKVEMSERITNLSDPRLTDQALRERYELEDSRDWVLKSVRAAGFDPSLIVPVNYRPFDIRWTYYHKDCHASPQRRVNDPMTIGKNLALCVPRQLASSPFEHCFVTSHVTEMSLISNKTKEANRVFPLYLGADCDSLLSGESNTNLSPGFVCRITAALRMRQPSQPAPEDIFHYAYATFHSPGYRSLYAEFLKVDFPRLPLTGRLELFHALARLGGELTSLHLLESPRLDQPITEFIGNRSPEVEKVSWTRDTVYVDKAQTIGFRGVRERVWNFHIGGYQVCEKWLKDRKGRKLTKDDIEHYQKIVVALSETIRLMAEIDKVIDEHGGWPGAFQATK
jgi:predicted helicase